MKKYTVEVEEEFIDKNTKKHYLPEKTVYQSSDKERVKFLQDAGYLGDIIEEKSEEPEQTPVQKALDGNVDEVKANVDTLSADELKEALEAEKKGKNRKGVTDHIKDLLKEETNESSQA